MKRGAEIKDKKRVAMLAALLRDLNQFGPHIKAARKDLGISRERLAARLDISARTIYSWEEAGRFPRLPTLSKLIELLENEPTNKTSRR